MIVTVSLVVAMVACVAAGIFISRRIRLTEYTSYRLRGSFREILFSLLASLIGGWMFFGLAAIGYEAGTVGYVMGISYAIGLLIIGHYVPRIKHAMTAENADTMDDFVGSRYGKTTQSAVSIINLTFFLAVLAAQFIALTAFLGIFFTIEMNVLFYVAVAVVVFYTALAGFKGVLFTDVWQFWLIAFTVVVVFLVLTFNADWAAVKSLDIKYFNGTGYGVAFLVGILVFLPLVQLFRTDLWQRVACAKEERAVQRAFYTCAPILLLFYVLMTTIGIYARVHLGEGVRADTSGLVSFLDAIGYSTLGGSSFMANLSIAVLSLGVFAALLSTVDTNLNVVSVAISKLFRRRDWSAFERETPDKVTGARSPLENDLIRTARMVSVILGGLGLVVAKLIPDIVNLIVGAASMLLVFVPAVFSTLRWKKQRVLAATSSIIAGYATFLYVFVFINPKMAFLPGTLIAFVTYFILRFFSKNAAR